MVSGAPTNTAPPDALVLRRFEWIPPFASPRVIAAQFPRDKPVISVEHLLVADKRLWAALRPRQDTNLVPGRGRLWSYTDSRGLLEPVRGVLEIHSITALAADQRRLWLGLNGGLASLEFSSGIVDPYGPAQGFVSSDIAGVGLIDGTVVALGRYGILWGMVPGSSNFIRASDAAPSDNPRAPSPWIRFATSRDWMGAVSDATVALRHRRGQQWIALRDELANGSPRLDAPRFGCLAGDGDGGFWIGSDAGLHWINPESNITENRFAPLTVTIPGGLGMSVAAGYQPSPAAFALARERVMSQIRDRMRDRARYARASAGLRDPINPIWPTSRLPGGVTALCRDGELLWIAATDGRNANRSRILLLHQPTRRWIGWFSVGAPVNAVAVDSQRLWLGLDVTRSPGLSPLLVVNRPPLVAVPPTKWVKDALSPEELGDRLSALPLKEQAVLAFFGGQSRRVVELLAPEGEPTEDTDAESLFLLAFAHDLIGLNDPDRLDHFVDLLRARHPDSLFTELASGVRSARPAVRVEEEPQPLPRLEPVEVVVEAVSVPEEPPAPTAPPPSDLALLTPEEVLRIEIVLNKRDLNRDGSLNPVEFRLWLGPQADFAKADTNQDGQVSSAEIHRILREEVQQPPAVPEN